MNTFSEGEGRLAEAFHSGVKGAARSAGLWNLILLFFIILRLCNRHHGWFHQGVNLDSFRSSQVVQSVIRVLLDLSHLGQKLLLFSFELRGDRSARYFLGACLAKYTSRLKLESALELTREGPLEGNLRA